MAEPATKLSIKTEEKTPKGQSTPTESRPLDILRQEVDRLFERFDRTFWRSPIFGRSAFNAESFWPRQPIWGPDPAIDIVEKDKTYEITAELPGMDQKNVEVTTANGSLVIKGEKKEEREEKKKDFYLSERRYGSFERRFQIPEGVATDKIEASFKNGVLTVTLPKKAEAQKPEKKIDIRAA